MIQTLRITAYYRCKINGVATLLPPDLSVHDGKIPSQEHYTDIRKKNQMMAH